jgi:hypothetical protein
LKNKKLMEMKYGKFTRTILIRIQDQNGKWFTLRPRPKKGNVYFEADIEEILQEMADRLDKSCPDYDYRMVQLPGHHYNFICTGKRGEQSV